MFLELASLAFSALDKIPTGKGKRKASVNYLAPEAEAVRNLADLLEISANAGESLQPIAQKIFAERLRVTASLISTTVAAIGDDTPES